MGLNAEIQHKNQYSNKYFEDNSYTLLSSKTRIYLYRNGMELFTELIMPIKQQYNQLETLPFKMNVEVGVNLLIDRK